MATAAAASARRQVLFVRRVLATIRKMVIRSGAIDLYSLRVKLGTTDKAMLAALTELVEAEAVVVWKPDPEVEVCYVALTPDDEEAPERLSRSRSTVSETDLGREIATLPDVRSPAPSLGAEASDEWAKTTAKAERVASCGKFHKSTKPPWPRILIGMDVGWDSRPIKRGRCPGCRGRKLEAIEYCLYCDSWGIDGEIVGGCPEMTETMKWPSTDWLQPGYMAPGRKEAIARERKERQAAKASKAKPPGPTRKERKAAMRAKLEGKASAG